MTKINNFRAIALMAAAALATSLLMMTNLLGDPARASTLEATLAGAGDIASCSHHRDRATANVVGNVQGTVFTLGDNVYPDGTAAQFRDCYNPTWGKYKRRTVLSVGNHEYHTQDASGYFGARAGAPSKGYYSYKRGSWRVVVLNSNCSEVVGGCVSALSRRAARSSISWKRCGDRISKGLSGAYVFPLRAERPGREPAVGRCRLRGGKTMGVVYFGSPAVVTPQRPQVQERQSGHV
jgi:hypothetical protein